MPKHDPRDISYPALTLMMDSHNVTLPGDASDRILIKVGELQGSILGPLLFFALIGDIVEEIMRGFTKCFQRDPTLIF